MRRQTHKVLSPSLASVHDEDFFDDMLGLFPDALGFAPKAGNCGKYIYDGKNWTSVIDDDSSYYPAIADHDLMILALKEISEWGIPAGTPYVDLGAGGAASFQRYALPAVKAIGSKEYMGVDFCDGVLAEIEALKADLSDTLQIDTVKLDLFFPTTKVISNNQPALGVMNGLTIGNIGNADALSGVALNLVSSLKYLSQLCGHGWLLISTDTNQNESALLQSYDIPALQHLFLNVMVRMGAELPVNGFDPSLFVYEPILNSGLQRLAHMAVATEEQDFYLGQHHIHVNQNQQIHLLNSYKFSRQFFEDCCKAAGLSTVKCWQHDSGVMLYLLKDGLCSASCEQLTDAAITPFLNLPITA